jgi:histidinol dehydrogenase
MVAGPSEVLIISDGSGNPDWVAMDLFAQAEHDELAQSILLCTDAAFIARVEESIARLLPEMPRRDTIATSLKNRGALIHVRDLAEACRIANRIAPEHLELSLADPYPWIDQIRHAGAIFIGHYSVEALGDYCAGPNHVLPTMRSARFSSPLGCTTSRSAPASSTSPRPAPRPSARSRRCWPTAKACRPTPVRPRCA